MRATHVLTGEMPAGITCDSCGQEALIPIVMQRYVHVFWVPCFPIGKQAYFSCAHCKKMVQDKDVDGLRPLGVQLKRQARAPIWVFLGLVIAAVLAVYFHFAHQRERQNTMAWAAAPAVGDLYIFDVDRAFPGDFETGFDHIIAKAKVVNHLDIEVQFGTKGYLTESGAEKAIDRGYINETGYFAGDFMTITNGDLKDLATRGALLRVVRE